MAYITSLVWHVINKPIGATLVIPFGRESYILSKMPTYKLTYFDERAKAEPARYMFELAGLEYEDTRVTRDEWKAMKATTGLGQLPVLEVDGIELPQSGAIDRYIGRKHGFYPSDAWECAQIDVVTETVNDFQSFISKVFRAENDEAKAEVIKSFLAEGGAKQFSRLEKLLTKNKEGKGWFVGDKISLADIRVFSMLNDMLPPLTGVEVGCLDLKDHPHLAAFMDRFKSEEKISKWIKKRPVTKF